MVSDRQRGIKRRRGLHDVARGGRDGLAVVRRVLRPLRRADLRRRGRADGHSAVRVEVPELLLRGEDGGNGVIRPDVLRGVTNETHVLFSSPDVFYRYQMMMMR